MLTYRAKVGAWSLLFVSLLVGFILVLIWWPVRTPLLMTAVTDYDAPLPPNAWATEDIDRLRQLGAEKGGWRQEKRILACTDVPWESRDLGKQRLRQYLEAARPGGPGKNLVMIYLGMHGTVDSNGEPCLVPPGASPRRARSGFPSANCSPISSPKTAAGSSRTGSRNC